MNLSYNHQGYQGYLWAEAFHLTQVTGAGDLEPPEKVTHVTVTDTEGGLEISWNHSWDNFNVSLYRIYRDDPTNCIAHVSSLLSSFVDSDLQYNREYCYWVSAVDLFNNTGVLSEPVCGVSTKDDSISVVSTGGSGGTNTFMPSSNVLPMAQVARQNISGNVGDEIFFDGSPSVDPDGVLVNYTWDFGDGSVGYGMFYTHTYFEAGRYTVNLTVRDTSGESDVCRVFVTINPSNTAPDTPEVKNETVGFGLMNNATRCFSFVSSDVEGDSLCYVIDWGDNTTERTAYVTGNVSVFLCHTWLHAGVYALCVYAEDSQGALSNQTMVSVCIDVNIRYVTGGVVGYLIDRDNDLVYDFFHNNETGVETVVGRQDGGFLIDSDNDGLPDGNETYGIYIEMLDRVVKTDPKDNDTDDDGLVDGDEGASSPISNKTDRNNPDTDNDGLGDLQEIILGLDPTRPDTDGDLVSDGDEFLKYGTDPHRRDSDNDLLNDGEELFYWHSNPLLKDSDNDGIPDGEEVLFYFTNPMDEDSDNDNLTDREELFIYKTIPLAADSDGDNIWDGDEVFIYHTNPLNWDSDNDTIYYRNDTGDYTWPMSDYDEIFRYNTKKSDRNIQCLLTVFQKKV